MSDELRDEHDDLVPPTMTTYRMADGSLVWGEFSFVTEPDFFDDADDPLLIIRERWELADHEVVELPQAAVERRDALEAELLELDELPEPELAGAGLLSQDLEEASRRAHPARAGSSTGPAGQESPELRGFRG